MLHFAGIKIMENDYKKQILIHIVEKTSPEHSGDGKNVGPMLK